MLSQFYIGETRERNEKLCNFWTFYIRRRFRREIFARNKIKKYHKNHLKNTYKFNKIIYNESRRYYKNNLIKTVDNK